jgi:hypothetical protein
MIAHLFFHSRLIFGVVKTVGLLGRVCSLSPAWRRPSGQEVFLGSESHQLGIEYAPASKAESHGTKTKA